MEKLGNTLILFTILCTCGLVCSVKLISQPGNVTVLQGEDAEITWQIEKESASEKVFWLRGSTIFGNEYQAFENRYTITGEDGTYTLLIPAVTIEDEKPYRCQIIGAGDGNGDPIIQTRNLIVNIPATVVMSPEDEVLEMERDEKLELDCEAEGKPEPTVTWTRRGATLPDGSDKFIGSHFEVEALADSDSGEYQCTASNGFGNPVTESMEVNVRYPPEVYVSEELIHTGPKDELNIKCTFKASPEAEVTWSHNDSEIDFASRPHLQTETLPDGTSKLSISSVEPQDLGKYTCKGTNNRGTATADITLTGKILEMHILSDDYSMSSDNYHLEWQVTSVSQVIECYLQVEMVDMPEEPIGNASTSWNATIPANFDTESTVHNQEYEITGLLPDTEYNGKLACKNEYGIGNPKEFVFNTQKEGFTLPPTTQTTTTQKEEPAKTETIKDNVNGAVGVTFSLSLISLAVLLCLV